MVSGVATFPRNMEKKSKKTGKAKHDRHLPRVIIGIPKPLAEMYQPLADRRMRSLSKQIIDVLLEYAESHGLMDKPKPPQT